MLARPKLKRVEPQIAIPQKSAGARQVDARYVLRVDGLTKTSFEEREPALKAAQKIKRAYPIVVVTITDVHEETTERIALPELSK
jgi:hypothetical protein